MSTNPTHRKGPPRRPYVFRITLPIGYIVALIVFAGFYGAAGHGWGAGVAGYISLPASLALVFDLPGGDYWPLLALVQYFLIGYALDFAWGRWVRGVRKGNDTFGERCVKCGYLLRGLPENRCPECGTPFEPAAGERGPDQ